MQPLEEYLKQFDVYKEILSVNPIEFAEAFNAPEAPREIGEIQAEIQRVSKKT